MRTVGRTLSAVWGAVSDAAPSLIRDVAGLVGVASMAYGAWLAWPPAGYFVGGAMLFAGAWRLRLPGSKVDA